MFISIILYLFFSGSKNTQFIFEWVLMYPHDGICTRKNTFFLLIALFLCVWVLWDPLYSDWLWNDHGVEFCTYRTWKNTHFIQLMGLLVPFAFSLPILDLYWTNFVFGGVLPPYSFYNSSRVFLHPPCWVCMIIIKFSNKVFIYQKG